ncbi:MAG: SUMF1/EgtB/PvdO family nonheme iron enzyme [Tannerella sp.]|jgi:formylglycine-generating enzyme required for sulfatase activity|nr:SUMF1/EgtB/PvdO family nonheme iron enzyme [Tannerella sp.]
MENKELTAGTVLQQGKYTIERVIGSGGFGITYYARHNVFGHNYAVKEFFISGYCVRNTANKTVMLQGMTDDVYGKYLQKFIDEAGTLARLDHPNIVKVTDIFRENGTAYIVMNFIEGRTLQKLVDRQGRLPYETAVNYIAQIAEAVDYIHSRNILHRDIKPENIIITPDNRAVLLDFGSAREFVHDKTQMHTSILTPGYAPPEQYSNTSRKGAYSDIYSLGATFYFALTATMPTDAAARSFETLPEPKTLVPNIPDEANHTIMKAMQTKPEDRYQHVNEFMGDLLNKSAVTQKPYKPENKKSSNKKRIIVGSAIGIIGVLVIVGGLLLSSKAKFQNFTETDNGVDFEMLYVAGGTFTMGCTSEQGGDCWDGEKPAHQVTLSGYYIGKYEVTQAQWKAVMGNNPSDFKGDNLPVENVSWNDVQEFIRKLNAQTGKNYRLPTEAEWEFAARGGNQSRGYKYSGSNTADNVAWYCDNSGGKTHPVGTKQANELGIYDMSGNVLEWCSDWYDSYSSASQTNPRGASTGSNRVLRGGSCYYDSLFTRVSNRNCNYPDDRYNHCGFRLALSSN